MSTVIHRWAERTEQAVGWWLPVCYLRQSHNGCHLPWVTASRAASWQQPAAPVLNSQVTTSKQACRIRLLLGVETKGAWRSCRPRDAFQDTFHYYTTNTILQPESILAMDISVSNSYVETFHFVRLNLLFNVFDKHCAHGLIRFGHRHHLVRISKRSSFLLKTPVLVPTNTARNSPSDR